MGRGCNRFPTYFFVCVHVASSVAASVVNMVDLSVADYASQARDGVLDLFGQLADTAVNAMCSIYHKSPGSIVQGEFTGGGLLNGTDAFYRNLCSPKGLVPPAPVPPFEGGQCPGVTYNVNGSYVIATTGTTNHYSSPGLEGKIGGVSVRPVAGTSPQAYAVFVQYGGGSTSGTRYFQVSGQDTNPGLFASPTIDSVTVSGGGSDTCGNPPTSYPKVPLADSDFNFNAPISIAPSVTVNVPVSINPTVVAVANVFRPEFNVNVGGINVNASLGGFTFSPTVQIQPGTTTPSDDPRALPPTPISNEPGKGQSATPIDLKPIKDKLDEIDREIEECCDRLSPFDPPPSAKVGSDEVLIANSGDFVIPSKTFKVTLEITARPTQEKVEFGNDAPNVVYAGWAWFGDGLSMGQRLPMDADFKVFTPPDRISKRFAFTMRRGYQALARVYYIV